MNAAQIALHQLYENSTDGSTNVSLYKLLMRLAAANAMPSYSGTRPVTAVAEFLESFGETMVTKQFRRDHSAAIADEAKR